MLGRLDQGFIDDNAMAKNAALSGSILAEPIYLVMITCLVVRLLQTR